MTTSELRAALDPQGQVVVKFACHITEHQARELLDAMAETLGAQHTGGKVIYVEKDEQYLQRKAPQDLSQQTIPEVLTPEYEVIPEPDEGCLTDDDAVPDTELPDYEGTEEPDQEDLGEEY